MPGLQLPLLPQGKTALLALQEPENQEPSLFLSFREKKLFSQLFTGCDPYPPEARLPLKTEAEARS